MKKLINAPGAFMEESVAGILSAYPRYLQAHPEDIRAIYRADRRDEGKVSIITGGGFGHAPLFLGYVGEGLCDGVAVGNVFSTPGENTICLVTRAVPVQRGVLYIIGNYMGDQMNFEMATERVESEGVTTRLVRISDDVNTAPRSAWQDRRGISGLVFAYKIAGAAARRGCSLEEVERLAQRVNANMATYGFAFAPCQLPGTSRPVFSIGETEMELGVGIHGESGVHRVPVKTSRELAKLSVETLVEDLHLTGQERVAVLINGLGATSLEEQFIFYGDVQRQLQLLGIQTVCRFVGEFATSLEMCGASVTLLRVDNQLLELLEEPAHSPFVNFL